MRQPVSNARAHRLQMDEQVFRNRLKQQREEEKPDIVFPEGCYGAANAPLVFVGPSPGGGNTDTEYFGRNIIGGGAYWDYDFIEPFQEWSNGFRNSLKPIIESLLKIPMNEGAAKLFAFVNFDWIQNPDSSKVPISRIEEGKSEVLRVLQQIQPKIIVALDNKAYSNLISLLSDSYSLTDLKNQDVKVRTARANAYHWQIKAHTISGCNELDGTVLLKSLQHPARIFNQDYALRVAQSLRLAYEAIVSGKELCIFLE